MNTNYGESGLLCEWLADFFLPSFALKLRQDLNQSVFDYLFTSSTKALTTDLNKHLYSDLITYFSVCIQFESNIVYLVWLFSLFKPFLLTCFITLFLLPTTIFVFIYASSLFMFLSKHWSKLKVSHFYIVENHSILILNVVCKLCFFF